MNLEKVSILSQKIEGILGTVRTLKEENAKAKHEISQARAVAHDKALLLEAAKKELVDCKAALDARANQVNAQQEILNQREQEIAALSDAIAQRDRMLAEKNGFVEELNAKVQELNSGAESLGAQIDEKNEALNTINAQLIQKDATIASLMTQLNEKNNVIECLNEQLQAQNDEIAEAQDKFNQLVATIESELGTDIALDQGEDVVEPPLEAGAEESGDFLEGDADVTLEEPFEEPAEEVSENAEPDGAGELSEPQVDESVSQESEEGNPDVEVHAAEESDNDLFASNKEGSQTNFFG